MASEFLYQLDLQTADPMTADIMDYNAISLRNNLSLDAGLSISDECIIGICAASLWASQINYAYVLPEDESTQVPELRGIMAWATPHNIDLDGDFQLSLLLSHLVSRTHWLAEHWSWADFFAETDPGEAGVIFANEYILYGWYATAAQISADDENIIRANAASLAALFDANPVAIKPVALLILKRKRRRWYK